MTGDTPKKQFARHWAKVRDAEGAMEKVIAKTRLMAWMVANPAFVDELLKQDRRPSCGSFGG